MNSKKQLRVYDFEPAWVLVSLLFDVFVLFVALYC